MSAATVMTARAGTEASAIPADRARSLARWNRVLAPIHAIQFVAMLAIANTAVAFTVTVPTIKPLFEISAFAGIEPTSAALFSLPLAWVVASFLAMSATAHFLVGWPLWRPTASRPTSQPALASQPSST